MTRRKMTPWRKMARDMKPNRVLARYMSGGRHQTWTAIVKSPFKEHTVHTPKSGRAAYEKRMKKARAEQKKAADAHYRQVRQYQAQQPKPKVAPRPKSPPIAVDPRTGRAVTYEQAVKALREAQARADRLAAGLPGDPPRKGAAPKKAAPAPRKRTAAKKELPPIPGPLAPVAAPGKSLRGIYDAVTCPCQGTGRMYTVVEGRVSGSVSCPEHGRAARGARRIRSKRAMTDSGLSGLAAWLGVKYRKPRGNLDRKQSRAVRQAKRGRYAGPTVPCADCSEGVVNRALTAELRDRWIANEIAGIEAEGGKAPSKRKLSAAASRAYPLDRCQACNGLGVVPDTHAGPWFDRTRLPERHEPTARERGTLRLRRQR